MREIYIDHLETDYESLIKYHAEVCKKLTVAQARVRRLTEELEEIGMAKGRGTDASLFTMRDIARKALNEKEETP